MLIGTEVSSYVAWGPSYAWVIPKTQDEIEVVFSLNGKIESLKKPKAPKEITKKNLEELAMSQEKLKGSV